MSEISSLYLATVAAQAGLSLTWSKNPEDRFSRDGSILSMLQQSGFFFFPIEKCHEKGFLFEASKFPMIWAATWQNQQNECAPSEDSDQPGHPPSLIRAFAVGMKKSWVLSYPLSTHRRLLIRLGRCPGWSESSLGAYSFCWFCHVVAQLWIYQTRFYWVSSWAVVINRPSSDLRYYEKQNVLPLEMSVEEVLLKIKTSHKHLWRNSEK